MRGPRKPKRRWRPCARVSAPAASLTPRRSAIAATKAGTGFAAAVEAAKSADAVLLFLGEEQILSGEAHSRAFLNLPGAQEALVEEIAAAGKPIVAVILAGRPLTFHNVAAKSAAVLYAWHPGTMGGPAIAEVLFGDRAPSGKLPITFPRTVGQVPIYYAHLNTGRPASPKRARHSTRQPGRADRLHLEISGCRFHARISVRLRALLHAV